MSIPIKPIYLLADSQLLFWKPNGKTWLQTVRDQIDKDEPKAAYIGASNGDLPEFFSIFEGAMEQVGITDCRMIFSDYQTEDRTYLEDADLILLAGGDVGAGWRVIEQTGMSQDIIHKYYDNTLLMGISAGAVQLGLRGWSGEMPEEEDDTFETFKLIPYVLDAHDEANHWDRLKRMVRMSDSYVKGMGLPTGGGLVYHPDHTLEPIRHSITELARGEDELVQNLLFPPGDEPAGLDLESDSNDE
jgi:peptidase E